MSIDPNTDERLIGTVKEMYEKWSSDKLWNGLGLKTKRVVAVKKCLLPSCDVMTQHNGGYCSALCCKEHRSIK